MHMYLIPTMNAQHALIAYSKSSSVCESTCWWFVSESFSIKKKFYLKFDGQLWHFVFIRHIKYYNFYWLIFFGCEIFELVAIQIHDFLLVEYGPVQNTNVSHWALFSLSLTLISTIQKLKVMSWVFFDWNQKKISVRNIGKFIWARVFAIVTDNIKI